MKRITALFIVFFLLLGGIAAGNGISIDRLNLFDKGPLSFLTHFFAESSSPVTLLNHFMQQEGPLSSNTGKQTPPRPKTDSHDTVGCLPGGVSPKINIVRTPLPLPSNTGFAPVSPCLAGSPIDGAGPPGSPAHPGSAAFIPLFLLAFFVLLSRSNLPAAAMLLYAITGPGLAKPSRVFYLPVTGPDSHEI